MELTVPTTPSNLTPLQDRGKSTIPKPVRMLTEIQDCVGLDVIVLVFVPLFVEHETVLMKNQIRT